MNNTVETLEDNKNVEQEKNNEIMAIYERALKAKTKEELDSLIKEAEALDNDLKNNLIDTLNTMVKLQTNQVDNVEIKEEVVEEPAAIKQTVSKALSKLPSSYTQEELAHYLMDEKTNDVDYTVQINGKKLSTEGCNTIEEFINKYQKELNELNIKATKSGVERLKELSAQKAQKEENLNSVQSNEELVSAVLEEIKEPKEKVETSYQPPVVEEVKEYNDIPGSGVERLRKAAVEKENIKKEAGLNNVSTNQEIVDALLEEKEEIPETVEEKKVTPEVEEIKEEPKEEVETSYQPPVVEEVKENTIISANINTKNMVTVLKSMMQLKKQNNDDITYEYDGYKLDTTNCNSDDDALVKYADAISKTNEIKKNELLKETAIRKTIYLFQLSRGNRYNGMRPEQEEANHEIFELEKDYKVKFNEINSIDANNAEEVYNWLNALTPYINTHALSLAPGLNAPVSDPNKYLVNVLNEKGYNTETTLVNNVNDFYKNMISAKLKDLDEYNFFISDYKDLPTKYYNLNSQKTLDMAEVKFIEEQVRLLGYGIDKINDEVRRENEKFESQIAELSKDIDTNIGDNYFDNLATNVQEEKAVELYKYASAIPSIERIEEAMNVINVLPEGKLKQELTDATVSIYNKHIVSEDDKKEIEKYFDEKGIDFKPVYSRTENDNKQDAQNIKLSEESKNKIAKLTAQHEGIIERCGNAKSAITAKILYYTSREKTLRERSKLDSNFEKYEMYTKVLSSAGLENNIESNLNTVNIENQAPKEEYQLNTNVLESNEEVAGNIQKEISNDEPEYDLSIMSNPELNNNISTEEPEYDLSIAKADNQLNPDLDKDVEFEMVEQGTNKKGFFGKLKDKFSKKQEELVVEDLDKEPEIETPVLEEPQSKLDNLNLEYGEEENYDAIQEIKMPEVEETPVVNEEVVEEPTVNNEVEQTIEEPLQQETEEVEEASEVEPVQEENNDVEYDLTYNEELDFNLLDDEEDTLKEFVPVKAIKKISKDLYDKITSADYKSRIKKAVDKLKEHKKAVITGALVATAIMLGAAVATSSRGNNREDNNTSQEIAIEDTNIETPNVDFENFDIDENIALKESETENIESVDEKQASIEDLSQQAINNAASGNTNVYANSYDAMVDQNSVSAYAPSWENANGGSYYILSEAGLKEVSNEEAQTALENGERVIQKVVNEDQTIGFVNVEAESMGRGAK